MLIITTTLVAGGAISSSGNDKIQTNAQNTSNQIQTLVSNTEVIADNIADYMEKYYKMKEQGYTSMSGAKNDITMKKTSIVYLMENLYTFTNYKGNDPEFSVNNNILYQGVDAGLLPQSRSFHLGVKVNL